MTSYLWRELSEHEKNQIKEDAKKLILEFGEKIKGLKSEEEVFIERGDGVRDEIGVINSDEDFKKIMMQNSPKIKDGCIVAEKGGWVEK